MPEFEYFDEEEEEEEEEEELIPNEAEIVGDRRV